MRILLLNDDGSQIQWQEAPAGSQQPLVESRLSFSSIRADRHQVKGISVTDVVGVVSGKRTRVFQRMVSKKSDENWCISIITAARTLDFRTVSMDDFTKLYGGLLMLVSARRR